MSCLPCLLGHNTPTHSCPMRPNLMQDAGKLRTASIGDFCMIKWAAIFMVIAIIAAILGFTGIAGAATEIVKFLFFLFLAICVILFLVGIFTGKRLS